MHQNVAVLITAHVIATGVLHVNQGNECSNMNNDFQRKKIEFLNSVSYISDVSYFKNYSVREEYNKYGAVVYFNSAQEVIAIQTYWDNHILMKPNNVLDLEYLKQWKYAKWIWKISCNNNIIIFNRMNWKMSFS